MAKFLSKDGKFYMRDGKLLQKTTPLTWLINETPTVPSGGFYSCNFYFSQIDTTTIYTGFRFAQGNIFAGTGMRIYEDNQKTWVDEKYRLVTFTEEPDATILAWFEANAKPIKNTISKTWVINKSPDVSTDMLVTINFTSNGESFDQFQIDSAIPGIIYLKNGSGAGYQYDSGSWSYGEAYRTVVFETTPTGELLTWLQANAVPQ